MAQPTIVQSLTTNPFPTAAGSTGTTLSVTATFGPSGVSASASNVVFLFVNAFAGAGTSLSITGPSGWTIAGTHTLTATSNGIFPTVFAVFWRTGFTGSTQAVTINVGPSNTSVAASAGMMESAGASTTAPIDPNSGFLVSDGTITATGTATGPNLAPSLANTLAVAAFFSNDDFSGFLGARSGWTEQGHGSGASAGLPTLETQTYNSIPVVGTNLQTSVTIANVDSSPVTWNAYELFISPPVSGGNAIPPNYEGGMTRFTGGMSA